MRHYYVDPQSGDNTNNGAAATPWKEVQYALTEVDASGLSPEGSQINVKAGISSPCTTLNFGTLAPTSATPLVISGYSSVENDGGQGAISGSGEYQIISETTIDFIMLKDMRLHDCGTATYMVELDDACVLVNCEFDDGTGTTALRIGGWAHIYGCHFHNFAGNGIDLTTSKASVEHCYFKNETNDFTNCIYSTVAGHTIAHNIFDVDGTTTCLSLNSDYMDVHNNTFYSNGGTGTAIYFGAGDQGHAIINNVIEGFSGAGGFGIESNGVNIVSVYGSNAAYNCETEFDPEASGILNVGENEVLTTTPFLKRGSNTYANRFQYFRPRDVGNVRYGAYPKGGL